MTNFTDQSRRQSMVESRRTVVDVVHNEHYYTHIPQRHAATAAHRTKGRSKTMFYALSDAFTGDNPREITYGFANCKIVIAFKTKAARDQWLNGTRLKTAIPLTRAEAMALTNWQDAQNIIAGGYGKVKAVKIHGATDDDGNDVYHVLAEKD